jgi:hypothetical protein
VAPNAHFFVWLTLINTNWCKIQGHLVLQKPVFTKTRLSRNHREGQYLTPHGRNKGELRHPFALDESLRLKLGVQSAQKKDNTGAVGQEIVGG